MEFSDTQLKIY